MNVVNKNSLTALDIIEQMPQDVKTREIKDFLIKEGATTNSNNKIRKMWSMWNMVKNLPIFQDELKGRDETLLIGATVIAAMAYAAAISPPGGVAGMDAKNYDDPQVYNVSYRLEPGSSILGYFYYAIFNRFWRYNTISFMAALSVIFIYRSGASLKKKFVIWLIRAVMWVTLSVMTLAYLAAVEATTPRYSTSKNTNDALKVGLHTWMILMGISVLVVICRIGLYIVRAIGKKSKSKVAAGPFTTPIPRIVIK